MTDPVDFDEYTEQYNRLLQERTSFFSKSDAYFAKYKVDLMKVHVGQAPVKRLLEYGCGIGRNIPYLKEAFPDAEIVGTDISRASLDIARQDQPGVEFIVEGTAVSNLGRFDLIFVAGVFHHIPAPQRTQASELLYQRVNESGNLFIFEHNPYNPVTRRIVSNCPYDEDAVLLAPKELRQYLLTAGFHHEQTQYCLFIPPRLSKLTWLEPKLGWLPLGGQYFVHVAK